MPPKKKKAAKEKAEGHEDPSSFVEEK